MSTLTSHRPVASLPFDGKYRLIDFPLSSLANAGIRSVLGFSNKKILVRSFDHIRSGREWGLSTLLSHYYLGIYSTPVEKYNGRARILPTIIDLFETVWFQPNSCFKL